MPKAQPTVDPAAPMIQHSFPGAELIASTVPTSVPATVPVNSQPSLFAALVANADTVDGHTLEKNKANLVGVPLVITAAVFRDGVPRPDKSKTNYVSCEAVVADGPTLSKLITMGRLDASVLSRILPDEQIVINDGSSGICRQVVAYAHARGYIEVPAGPEAGGDRESRYDTYRGEWIRGQAEDGGDVRIEFPGGLYCPRGLRASEYTNDFGDATTYYLG